jgi:hypothetical protein
MMRTGRILHTHALLHAGLHTANYARGRTKAVWVSTSADLRMDAERDLRDLGCPIKVINGTKVLHYMHASCYRMAIFARNINLFYDHRQQGMLPSNCHWSNK